MKDSLIFKIDVKLQFYCYIKEERETRQICVSILKGFFNDKLQNFKVATLVSLSKFCDELLKRGSPLLK